MKPLLDMPIQLLGKHSPVIPRHRHAVQEEEEESRRDTNPTYPRQVLEDQRLEGDLHYSCQSPC